MRAVPRECGRMWSREMQFHLSGAEALDPSSLETSYTRTFTSHPGSYYLIIDPTRANDTTLIGPRHPENRRETSRNSDRRRWILGRQEAIGGRLGDRRERVIRTTADTNSLAGGNAALEAP